MKVCILPRYDQLHSPVFSKFIVYELMIILSLAQDAEYTASHSTCKKISLVYSTLFCIKLKILLCLPFISWLSQHIWVSAIHVWVSDSLSPKVILLHLDLFDSWKHTAAVSPPPEFCFSPFRGLEPGCISWWIIPKLHFLVIHGVIILLLT